MSKIIPTMVFVAFFISASIPVKAQAPIIEKPIIRTPIEEIAYYADMYNVSRDELASTSWCEGRVNPKSHNKLDPNGGSMGLLNFQQSTFNRYAKEIGIENPDIWNYHQSAQVSAYMFSIGEAKQWTTWRAIDNGGSFTFFYRPLNKKITIYCKLQTFDTIKNLLDN